MGKDAMGKEATGEVKEIVLEKAEMRRAHHFLVMSFAQKVLTVLLAEALSSTAYQILTTILANGKDYALVARSIYAAIITIYSPVMSWFLTQKCAWARGDSFLALTLQFHAKICPVLLAWGWKDWGAQWDTWAGPKIWDELIVAGSMTVVIMFIQLLPCSLNCKLAVAAGGESDTILARIAIVPACFGLTLGYVWNTVATYPVGKLQGVAPGYDFDFAIQAGYTLLVGIAVTIVTVALTEPVDKQDDAARGKPNAHLDDWSGVATRTWKHFITSTLSFVYAWALLDTMDDWAFGVMFGCSSYSACSYQNNFCYALGITIAFVAGAMLLHQMQQFTESAALSQAIALQLNAMMLTVGWAWMNFYSVFMTSATSRANDGISVLLYIIVLVVILVFTKIVNYIYQTVDIGLNHKQVVDSPSVSII